MQRAIALDRLDMLGLIFNNCQTTIDLNLLSDQGTALHVACKKANLKLVQKLVLMGAKTDIAINGKLAKDSTDSQKIVYLLEKYEM